MSLLMVDTSAFYAAVDPEDARGVWIRTALRRHTGACWTTNGVVAEFLTLARARRGHAFAVAVGAPLMEGALAGITRVTEEDEGVAWRLFSERDLRGLSFTDCTTVAAMRRLGIPCLLTLDGNFPALGIPVLQQTDLT